MLLNMNTQNIATEDAILEGEVEARKKDENSLRALIETMPIGIVIANEHGQFNDVNAETLRMFGYGRKELIGEPVEKLLPERLRSSHKEHRFGYTKQPHTRPIGIGMELLGCRKDGTEFPVEVSLAPLQTSHGSSVASTIVDISERKKIERQLRLAQRMEAIGQFAGGIAHDFNNLLAVIIGCADILGEALSPNESLSDKVAMIKNAGNSAADLVRQLLAFSRQQMLQPRVLDLKEILERTQPTLERLIGEDIKLELSVAGSLGHIKADPGQIEQVLLNLAVNARDAMPKGGHLTITASNVELDDSYKRKHEPVVPGDYVRLTVEDTGCGMDAHIQSRIFDPFFTTRELGKRTGLGLATVYGIVKQTAGYIWVYSEVGQGTAFKIYLPRIEQALEAVEPHTTDLPVTKGWETILFAEDSESLREMAGEYLQSVGYTVLAAASGNEALERAKDFEGTIHLLLTDVVMPELNGPELAKHIASLRPGIKVIFTSGYASETLAHRGSLDPTVAFIQKPYRPKALARRIREVLDGSLAETVKT
jgi:two-component system, cell cycle sensor histidine kinase and response regulator CckA